MKKINFKELLKKINFKFYLLLLALIIFGLILSINSEDKSLFGPSTGKVVMNLPLKASEMDYQNLNQEFTNNEMMKDLPKDTKILLRFYNFNSGFRQWEKSYVFNLGTFVEGSTEDYDLLLYMHSSYLAALNSYSVCSIIKSANKNGDLGVEMNLPATKALWKYRSLLKYKSCL